MYIVHVFCHVKPEFVDEFKALCEENARNSVQEPGIARFDVIQQQDDPTRIALIEVYRTPDDPAKHKETAHYAAWAAAVENSKIRTGTVHRNMVSILTIQGTFTSEPPNS